MQNITVLLLCVIFMALATSVVYSQERIGIPKTIVTPKAASPFDAGIMSAPDQIGFRKLSIDTTDINFKKEKYTGSSYRSISLYLGLHQKEFRKWETEIFNAALLNIDLNLGSAPKAPGASFSLFGIPVSITYMAPGVAGTKISTDGIPKIYPIQAREYNDFKKQMERTEREIQERRKQPFPIDGEEFFDEALCFVNIGTMLISRQNNSFLDKLL